MPVSRSTQPRKQRKAVYDAARHRVRQLMAAHLDGDLILKYNRRSLTVVIGDTVKVMRGSYKGHTGKVAEIDAHHRRIVVEGVTVLKADGTKVPRPVDASNVVITKMNLADPYRRAKLVASVKGSEAERKKALAELETAGKADAAAVEEARKKAEEERAAARAEREAAEAEGEEGEKKKEES